jgi:hypothetical protein
LGAQNQNIFACKIVKKKKDKSKEHKFNDQNKMPMPLAAWTKTWFCGRSIAGIVGSNTAGGMDVSFRE